MVLECILCMCVCVSWLFKHVLVKRATYKWQESYLYSMWYKTLLQICNIFGGEYKLFYIVFAKCPVFAYIGWHLFHIVRVLLRFTVYKYVLLKTESVYLWNLILL